MEKKPLIREEEIFELVKKLLGGTKTILIWVLSFFVLGVVVALTNRKEYTTEVVVAPESGESSTLGGLGSLAAMAGINIDALDGSDAIYPMLYPEITGSLPFVISLLDTRVQTVDGSVDTTYQYYRSNIHKQNLVTKVTKFPKRMVKKFIRLFTKPDKWSGDASVFDPYFLSESQLLFIDGIKKDFSVKIDKKTDVISLSFTEQDPKVAAIMAEALRLSLQKAIVDYRTGKATADFNYVSTIYQEAKDSYEESQMKYADFCDRNRNIVQERILVEKNRLEADMELKNTLFSQWAQQLEVSRAKIQQNTPVFTTLSPAAIPALPSSPRKLKTIFLFIILGVMAGSCYVIAKDPVLSAFRKLKTR